MNLVYGDHPEASLSNQNPHFQVVGVSGSGKTNLVKTLIAQAAKPLLIDLSKDGSDHPGKWVTTAEAAYVALVKIVDHVKNTMTLLAEYEVASIDGLPDEFNPGAKLIVWDEFFSSPDAAVKCLSQIDFLLERGRCAGVRVVLVSVGRPLSPIAHSGAGRQNGVVAERGVFGQCFNALRSRTNLARLALGQLDAPTTNWLFREPKLVKFKSGQHAAYLEADTYVGPISIPEFKKTLKKVGAA
jgi:hypothetical protein